MFVPSSARLPAARRTPRPSPYLLAAVLGALAGLPLGVWIARRPPLDAALPAPERGPIRAAAGASARPARVPTDEELVRAALQEARSNCVRAEADLPALPGEPWLSTAALRAALDTELLARRAHGELPALRREARWIAGLRSVEDAEPASGEDLRLLLSAIHGYLVHAAGASEDCTQRFDPASLRLYSGLEPGDLLGLWD